MIYQRYGTNPNNPASLRKFVSDALTVAGIPHPDIAKHPVRLDEWIYTPVEMLDPDEHEMAAEEAMTLLAKHANWPRNGGEA